MSQGHISPKFEQTHVFPWRLQVWIWIWLNFCPFRIFFLAETANRLCPLAALHNCAVPVDRGCFKDREDTFILRNQELCDMGPPKSMWTESNSCWYNCITVALDAMFLSVCIVYQYITVYHRKKERKYLIYIAILHIAASCNDVSACSHVTSPDSFLTRLMLDLHTRKKQSATVRLGPVNPTNPIFKALQLLSYFREKGRQSSENPPTRA